MVDIGSFFFGSEPKLDVKTKGLLSDEQARLLNEVLLPFLQQSDVAQSITDVPGVNPLEAGTILGFEDLLAGQLTGEGSTETAAGTLGDILTRDPTDIDDFFETNVAAPLLEQFEEDIIPDIGNRFAGQFFGGERRDAEAQAREDLIDALVRGRADVALRGREFDTGAQIQAAGLTPSIDQAPILELLGIQEGAGLPRNVSLAQLAQQNQRIQQVLAALGLKTKENIGAGLPGQTGAVQSATDAFAQGFGSSVGFGAAASSKAFKENGRPIEQVLPRIAELKVEAWDYKDGIDDGSTHIGPYAEDFQRLFGVGDGVSIHMTDAIGVCLLGIKELIARTDFLLKQIRGVQNLDTSGVKHG